MYEEKIYRLIERFSLESGMEQFQDVIINEQCFNVYINGTYYENICCTPSHLDELMTGQLAMKGEITHSSDIKKMEITNDNIMLDINKDSKVVSDKKTFEVFCTASRLTELMREHLNISDLHKQTGGVHIMSLANQEGLLVSREDVGRHNAVEKLYGYCLINNVSCGDKIFLSSGRISFEIIKKLQVMGVKLAVSRAAVTSLGQSIAEQSGITIVGFARGNRFNIYTHPYRIKAGEGR